MKPKKNPKANLEKRTRTFFLIGLLFSIGSLIIAFEWHSYDQQTEKLKSDINVPEEEQMVDVTQQKKKKPKPPAPPEINIVSHKFPGDDDDKVPPADIVETDRVDLPPAPEEEGEEEPEIFRVVEDQPAFPGGEQELFNFIRNEIEYPEQAKENGIEGTVVVDFIIDESGNITNVKIAKGVTDALDKEAKRVVRNMPNWEPGKQRGKKVHVRMNLPIRFSLQN